MSYSQEDRQAMCNMFERLLEDRADEATLRKRMQTESGFNRELWQTMADLGLTGIVIPTENAGAGGSLEEVEALMEVAGGFLFNGPLIDSCVVAPTLLAACVDPEFSGSYLEEIAVGKSIFAVAGCGQSGDWTLPPGVAAQPQGDDWRLSGTACYVSFATVADYCLVYASIQNDVGVFLVAMDDPAISSTLHPSNDQTLRLSTLRFDGVHARKLPGVGAQALGEALNNALVALAGEQVGGSQRIFSLTIEYLKIRHQFGQPIGRFQALKHIAADLLIELESAASAARHAARVIAASDQGASLKSYLAAFTCADNFRKISAEAIQLHGGIAYTVEHPAHLYWRRAQSGQWLYCSSDRLRDFYLTEMEKML